MAIFDLESFADWLNVDSTGTVTKKTSKTYTVDNTDFLYKPSNIKGHSLTTVMVRYLAI